MQKNVVGVEDDEKKTDVSSFGIVAVGLDMIWKAYSLYVHDQVTLPPGTTAYGAFSCKTTTALLSAAIEDKSPRLASDSTQRTPAQSVIDHRHQQSTTTSHRSG